MATNTKRYGKAGVVARAQSLIAGANKHLTSGTPMPLAGQSLTPAQVVEQLKALVDLRTAVEAAKATTQTKIAQESAQAPPLHALMNVFEAHVKAAYAGSPDVLADFGLRPKARPTLTVDRKLAAAAKRASTRAARHVMGSQQRKAIKGDVTGITMTVLRAPAAEPAAPSPASPSPPAPSGSAPAPATAPHTTSVS